MTEYDTGLYGPTMLESDIESFAGYERACLAAAEWILEGPMDRADVERPGRRLKRIYLDGRHPRTALVIEVDFPPDPTRSFDKRIALWGPPNEEVRSDGSISRWVPHWVATMLIDMVIEDTVAASAPPATSK